MSHNSNQGTRGIKNLLSELSNEAPRVLAAQKTLALQIFNSIQDYHPGDESQISTAVLDTLTTNERQRVLEGIVGRYFENQESKVQYKVVKDGGQLSFLKEDMAVTYIHIPPPQ